MPFDSSDEIVSSFNLSILCISLSLFIPLFVTLSFTHLPPLLLLLLWPTPPPSFLCFSSAGAVATQLWWQEHSGRRRRQVLHRSPAYPVVGMDTAAPNLPGRLGRQTFVKSNQSGATFYQCNPQHHFNVCLFLFTPPGHLLVLLHTFDIYIFPLASKFVGMCALFVCNVHIHCAACSHAFHFCCYAIFCLIIFFF